MKGNTDTVTIVIFDAAGEPVMMQRLTLQDEHTAFAVTGTDKLPKGNYRITISWESGKKTTQTFTKFTG